MIRWTFRGGIGGLVGMVLTGVFAEEVGLIHGDSTIFVRHLLALVGLWLGLRPQLCPLFCGEPHSDGVRTDQEQRGLTTTTRGA